MISPNKRIKNLWKQSGTDKSLKIFARELVDKGGADAEVAKQWFKQKAERSSIRK